MWATVEQPAKEVTFIEQKHLNHHPYPNYNDLLLIQRDIRQIIMCMM